MALGGVGVRMKGFFGWGGGRCRAALGDEMERIWGFWGGGDLGLIQSAIWGESEGIWGESEGIWGSFGGGSHQGGLCHR